MFVYQNKEGHICVTFQDNKPVEVPEYVIKIDEENKKLVAVSGEITAAVVPVVANAQHAKAPSKKQEVKVAAE